MKIYSLVLEEQAAAGGANVRVEVTHADLTEATANTAQTLALLTVDAKMAVRLVKAVLVTPFKDASDAAFNTTPITVGDGSDVDRLLASMEMNVNGSEVLLKPGPVTAASAPAAPAAVTAVVATAAAATDDTTVWALANELKGEFNKAIADIAALRAAIVATQAALVSPCHVYTGADTVDLVVGSMAEKALADIDVGELHLFFQVIDHR